MLRFFSVLCLFFAGCASRIYLSPMRNEVPYLPVVTAVFVENPELQEEYKILQASRVFELSSNPNCENKILLKPIIDNSRVCGNVYMFTNMTLGLVPSASPLNYQFEFEIRGQKNYDVSLPLRVEMKYSLYERFKWWKPKSHQVLGQALAIAYLKAEIGESAI